MNRLFNFNPEVLAIVAERSELLAKHQFAKPSVEQINEAIDLVYESSGVNLVFRDMVTILNLYPEARIKLTLHGFEGDSDVRDLVLSAVSYFFLNCPWPIDKDKIDLTRFLAALQEQARAMKLMA